MDKVHPEIAVCAGGIVLGDSGTIAMVRNRKGSRWFFPKGHVDEGESLEEAARREVAEETGLTDVELLDFLGTYTRPRIFRDGTYADDQLKEIHMYLFSAVPHAELGPTLEIEEAKWVPLPHVMDELEDAKDRAWFASVFDRIRQSIQRD